jgi:hypothetical protein
MQAGEREGLCACQAPTPTTKLHTVAQLPPMFSVAKVFAPSTW